MAKNWLKYIFILGKRAYRPIRPLINPWLKKVKPIHLLLILLLVSLGGRFWPTHDRYRFQESAAWWPWSSGSHDQMALAWFNAGEEERALSELELVDQVPKRTEDVIKAPERTRKEMASWEKILESRPYAKGVLLRLAVLKFMLYEDEAAKVYWLRAQYLDPTSEMVKKVGELIKAI